VIRFLRSVALIGIAATLGGCASAPTRPVRSAGPQLEPIHPHLLAPGSTIRFVAPAGVLDPVRMALAKQRLEERGYHVQLDERIFAKEGYLAGTDEARATELMDAFLDPRVDAIFPGTGGYGTMRLFDRLDFAKIRANPKLFIGFSDITALHAALYRHAGLVTYHSPNPMWGLGSEGNLAPFSEWSFFRALEAADATTSYPIVVPAEAPQPVAFGRGKARGRLVGGNLSLVVALEGTPYAIETDGAILLLEDTREAPYRVDRMLRQLELAGRLDHLAGVVLGQFTDNYDREADQQTTDPRFEVDGVLRQYFAARGIPVLMNYPIGHHPMNATVPLGAEVEVDADTATLTVLARPAGVAGR
jgi:muramoyltetrapeptide carboxypeptidase